MFVTYCTAEFLTSSVCTRPPTVLLKSEETVCLVLKTAVSVETFVWFWKRPCLRKRFVLFWKRPCPLLWHRGPGRSWDPFHGLASLHPPLLSLVSESIVDSLSIPSDEIRTKTKQKAGGGGGGGGCWPTPKHYSQPAGPAMLRVEVLTDVTVPTSGHHTHSHFGQLVLQSALTGMVSSSVYIFNRPHSVSVPCLDVLSSPLPVSPASPCTVSKWSRS